MIQTRARDGVDDLQEMNSFRNAAKLCTSSKNASISTSNPLMTELLIRPVEAFITN
jgi:hypothetical protein